MPATYQSVTFAQAKAQLALRLNDPLGSFWTNTEMGLYLIEALRTWNSLTSIWNKEFTFDITGANPAVVWTNLLALAGYPRARTLTDSDLYRMIEYHLLEPPSGGLWTGSSQFDISDLAGALQRRRDHIQQLCACSLANVQIPAVVNQRRTTFATSDDALLELERLRFVPATGFGSPVTLWREDGLSLEYFDPNYLQGGAGSGQPAPTGPRCYDLVSSPPLVFDVDFPPQSPGSYDGVFVEATAGFSPPVPALLNVPDDQSWVLKWGAMADVLLQQSEAFDGPRGNYCLKRYQDGVKLMMSAPWILLAKVNGVPVDTPSLAEMDAYSCEWDSLTTAPDSLVVAGTDFVALCPPALTGTTSVQVVVVGNAPVPVLDTDDFQVSRDDYEVILDYAEHLAAFKEGGEEFIASSPLLENFVLSAVRKNSRIANLGIFRDILLNEGERQDNTQPRVVTNE